MITSRRLGEKQNLKYLQDVFAITPRRFPGLFGRTLEQVLPNAPYTCGQLRRFSVSLEVLNNDWYGAILCRPAVCSPPSISTLNQG